MLHLKERKIKRPTKFRPEEDERLRQIIEQYGTHNWVQIAAMMPGRNVRQCIDRWKRNNSPKNPRREWTPAEDNVLLEKFQLLGRNYGAISRFLPYRNDMSVKHRLDQLLGEKNRHKIEIIATMEPQEKRLQEIPANDSDNTLDRILNQIGLDTFAEQFDLTSWNQSSDLFKI